MPHSAAIVNLDAHSMRRAYLPSLMVRWPGDTCKWRSGCIRTKFPCLDPAFGQSLSMPFTFVNRVSKLRAQTVSLEFPIVPNCGAVFPSALGVSHLSITIFRSSNSAGTFGTSRPVYISGICIIAPLSFDPQSQSPTISQTAAAASAFLAT